MSKEEAEIVLLKAALDQSRNTIEFLHGCLTEPGYSYEYPDHTLKRLEEIEELIGKRQGYCFHSFHAEGCAECDIREKLREDYWEARKVLGLPRPDYVKEWDNK